MSIFSERRSESCRIRLNRRCRVLMCALDPLRTCTMLQRSLWFERALGLCGVTRELSVLFATESFFSGPRDLVRNSGNRRPT